MRLKKVILTIVFVTVMITALIGYNSKKNMKTVSNTQKLSGKIVFATNRTDIANTKLTALADEFMKSNVGTDISFEGIKDYDQTIEVRVSAGEAPDIYYFLPIMTTTALNKYYLPIDDLGFTKDSISFYSNGTDDGGKLYGITEAVSYAGIVYNKKAFESAGIKATPKTMDEFYSICERLRKNGITALGTAFKDQWPLYPWAGIDYVAATQTGSIGHKFQYSNQDKIIDGVMLNSFEIIRGLQRKGYLEKDLASSSWDRLKSDMAEAKVGMYYGESWLPPQMLDVGEKSEKIGMFPYPGSKAILATGGKNWGISRDTKSSELAKAFLKYLMMDGKLARAEGVISSVKGVTPSEGFVKELIKSGLPIVENQNIDNRYTELINKSEINLNAVLQAYTLAADDTEAEKIVKITNEKWAIARK